MDVEFEIFHIQCTWCAKLLQLKNIMQENLCPSVHPISAAKKKNIYLLKFILPIHYAFFQTLKTNRIEKTNEGFSNE